MAKIRFKGTNVHSSVSHITFVADYCPNTFEVNGVQAEHSGHELPPTEVWMENALSHARDLMRRKVECQSRES